MEDATWDDFFGGMLKVKQKKRGYRYSIDPVLLAHFVHPLTHAHVIDLGTGSGIIPLILSHRYPTITVTGIEIQESLAASADENIKDNGLDNRLSVLCCDMKRLASAGMPLADLVVSNPPFTRYNAGRVNPDHEKALARHEIAITLPDLLQTASSLLKTGGRLALIYPPDRLEELEVHLSLNNLYLNRTRMVYPYPGKPVIRILVEAVKSIKVCTKSLPPLFIFKEAGLYSDEVNQMFL